MSATRAPAPPRRRPRRRRSMSTLAAGALAAVALVLIVFFGFTKHVPFTHGFRLKAVFASANSIRPGSSVRIAGVNVGTVKSIDRFGNTDMSEITMELSNDALPLHQDATLKIRPRIFLEGNFFVDLRPGTPAAPTLADGDTVPVTQTATPVQLDQVLTALQSDTRQDLQDLLTQYGSALAVRPAPGADASQDPEVRGLTGAQALNRTLRYAPSALRGVTTVNEALLGTSPHDLSRLIASTGRVARVLDSRESALQDLVTNFNRTVRATADESGNLRASIRLLFPALQRTRRTLVALDRAFPTTRAFAREILPGVRQGAATIDAAFPWVRQTRALLGPKELRGLARETRPTVRDTSRLIDDAVRLNPQIDLVDRCLKNVILPAGNAKITADRGIIGQRPVENYKEFFYGLVGVGGEGQNFDGNGTYVRFQVGGGPRTYSTGTARLSGEKLLYNLPASPLGTAPIRPPTQPPYKPRVPCYTQKLPDYNGPAAGPRAPSPPVASRKAAQTPALLVPGLGPTLGDLCALLEAPCRRTAATSR